MKQSVALPQVRKQTLGKKLKKDFSKNKYIYLMLIPVIAFYIIFKYIPVTKMVIAFQDYNIFKGISGSEWVGFENFISFFQMRDFWRLIRNTLLLSLYSILFAFQMCIRDSYRIVPWDWRCVRSSLCPGGLRRGYKLLFVPGGRGRGCPGLPRSWGRCPDLQGGRVQA